MVELKSWRTVKLTLVREKSPQPITIRHGKDVAVLVREVIANDPRECLVAVYLDTRHRPIAVHRVSVGTADSTFVGPRDVFGPAVALAATSLVIAHNHPSGNPTPSAEDHRTTERIRAAGELLGVAMLDHIVIGDGSYYSFAEGAAFPL